MGGQLLRSVTSVGAHSREAGSDAEFVSKIEGGLQELEETLYRLEVMEESRLLTGNGVDKAQAEARQLNAILTTVAGNVKSGAESRRKTGSTG